MRTQIQRLGDASQGLGQRLLNDLEKLLAWRQALRHFDTERARFHLLHELPHHRQRHIRLEQCHAELAAGGIDLVFGQAPLTAQGVQHAGQTLAQRFKHSAVPSTEESPVYSLSSVDSAADGGPKRTETDTGPDGSPSRR